ncbi:MAG: hypothetical protein AAF562_00035 [Pseudomonadota bacterium]
MPHSARSLANESNASILDDKQLGHLAFIDQLSRQLPGDWSHMGASEPGQGYFDAYRYQIAMMSYALSLAQYHFTPAWREHHSAVSRRLIEKMLRFDVWGYWELTSRGDITIDPSLTVLHKGLIDPVRYQNIMYSGHLFQMITTHAMLYGDSAFELPGSISFDYNPFGRGLGRQVFDYDIHSLAAVIIDQFRKNGWRGIECEPNAIFPECNQHPIIACALYDQLYGTDYFAEVAEHFKAQFDDLEYLDKDTQSFMAYYQVKQNKVVRRNRAWSDGWSGTFMHAWSKAIVEHAYPTQRDRHIIRLNDGTATVKFYKGEQSYSHGHGFMATLAAELGDDETLNALLSYADQYWQPRWDGESLIYPRRDVLKEPQDPAHVWRRLQPLTANGLLALARIGGRNRIADMVSRPKAHDYEKHPMLSGVQYPSVQVQYARYAPERAALEIILKAGKSYANDQTAEFKIDNLKLRERYQVIRDGVVIAEVFDGNVQQVNSGVDIALQENHLAVSLSLKKQTSLAVTRLA